MHDVVAHENDYGIQEGIRRAQLVTEDERSCREAHESCSGEEREKEQNSSRDKLIHKYHKL